MKNIKIVVLLLLTIGIIVVAIVSCNKDRDQGNSTTTETTTNPTTATLTTETTAATTEAVIIDLHEGQAINPLTGLYIDEEAAARRPIGVMINNLDVALPQSGIIEADVIYETMVEGSITRLFALFQDFDSTKIGPVRSARHYFLDFAFDFDAIYVHYGKSPQALAAFTDLDAPHMEGLSYLDSIMCFQDPERKRPHSTYTSFDGLMAAWDEVGYEKDRNLEVDFKFHFAEEEFVPEGQKATIVTLPYSSYSTPWFEYDDVNEVYNRFEYGDPQIDRETGEQLNYTNIIIQIADMWVISGDPEGRMDMNLITKGTGYYVSKGAVEPITWEKKSHTEPTHYYNADGNELLLNTGKTWISVFPSSKSDKLLFE